MAAGVIVYVGSFCGYCMRVTALLERRGISYTEINVEDHPGLRDELLAKSGRRTLPQVYVDDRYVGGAEELAELDRSGGLQKLTQERTDDGR